MEVECVCFPLSNITGVTKFLWFLGNLVCFVASTKAALYVELVPVLCYLEVVLYCVSHKCE